MDWEKAYKILDEYAIIIDSTIIDQVQELINECEPVYRILKGSTNDTIKTAQERLTKETGYGVPNVKSKKRESKRKKTAESSKRYVERSVSQTA